MKERPNVMGVILWVTLLGFLIVAMGGIVFAEELRDYKLPRQKYDYNALTIPRFPTPAPAPADVKVSFPSAGAIPDDVYERFKSQVKSISEQERQKLKKKFEEKVGHTENRYEKEHYHKLIAILIEYGIK